MSIDSVSAKIIPTGKGTAEIVIVNGEDNISSIGQSGSAEIKISYTDGNIDKWPTENDGYIKVTNVDDDGEGNYVIKVGPEIIDPIALGGSAKDLRLRIRGYNPPINLPVKPEKGQDFLVPSGLVRKQEVKPNVATEPVQSEVTAAVEPQSATIAPAVEPSKKNKSKLPIILGILALLVLLGVGIAFYFLSQKGSDADADTVTTESTQETELSEKESPAPETAAEKEPPAPETAAEKEPPAPETATVSESAQNQASSSAASANGPELQSSSLNKTNPCAITQDADSVIIKNCLGSGVDDSTVLALVNEADKIDRCPLMKRVLIGKGRSSLDFAVMYAKLLDPNSVESSKCISKDKEQAAYWYDKAISLGAGDDIKQQRSALK